MLRGSAEDKGTVEQKAVLTGETGEGLVEGATFVLGFEEWVGV